MVTGHYGCGGVQAAFAPPPHGPLGDWLDPIRAVRIAHADELDLLPDDLTRGHRLCELNVMDQVVTLGRLSVITEAWKRGQPITLHGWIYDLRDGLIRDLGVSRDGPASGGFAG
jgi:carbonic anhydrase